MSTQFSEALMAAAGNAPCQSCQHAWRCGAELLACGDFKYYVIHGEMPIVLEGFDIPLRRPTAEVFNQIYDGDDNHGEDPN